VDVWERANAHQTLRRVKERVGGGVIGGGVVRGGVVGTELFTKPRLATIKRKRHVKAAKSHSTATSPGISYMDESCHRSLGLFMCMP